MTALLIFPCLALLWLTLSAWLGLVRDQPLQVRPRRTARDDRETGRPSFVSYEPVRVSAVRLSNSGPSKATRR